MKHFYSTLLFSVLKKSLLLFIVIFGAHYAANAQVYYGTLSGPNEFPSNTSPGTGKTVVTINGNFMRVQATFSGLVAQTAAGLPSGTTASHIHAPTALPLSLIHTAGVATQTPSFSGFPTGVRSGTYDNTFDMTLASSYNAAYITANGGTAASAFIALKTAIAGGRAYFNIHTNAFPGGEIRGYLVACPTINVTIPDAMALTQGVLPNTVYPAYSPATSLMLQTNVSGGTGPYTYNWTNGATTASTTVSPTVATTYSVTVRDQNGCPGTASKTINVMNVSGGNKGDKVVVCHKGMNSLTIGASGVADHLLHGDMLGECSDAGRQVRSINLQPNDLAVKVLSNPSPNHFVIQITSKVRDNIKINVYDNLGRVVESRSSFVVNQTVRLGSSYQPGTYLVEIIQGAQKHIVKLVKSTQ